MLLLHEAPKIAGWPGSHGAAQNSNTMVRRNGGSSPARQLGAVRLVLKTSSEGSTAKRLNSHSCSGAAGGQRGESFLRLGQPEGSGPELISTEVQAHRLVSVGPRWTAGSHHLNSTVHESLKFEITTTAVFFCNLKAVTEASNSSDTRMQNPSLQTAFLKSNIKTSVEEMRSLVPGQ